MRDLGLDLLEQPDQIVGWGRSQQKQEMVGGEIDELAVTSGILHKLHANVAHRVLQ